MRVVFDASTVIGAALKPDSLPLRALLLARTQHSIALSLAVFHEIVAVMNRPKFSRTIASRTRDDVVSLLSARAIWLQPSLTVTDCRDPKDNIYLELAAAAGAAAIVSSDQDLLTLDPWRGIRIVNARDFLMLEDESS